MNEDIKLKQLLRNYKAIIRYALKKELDYNNMIDLLVDKSRFPINYYNSNLPNLNIIFSINQKERFTLYGDISQNNIFYPIQKPPYFLYTKNDVKLDTTNNYYIKIIIKSEIDGDEFMLKTKEIKKNKLFWVFEDYAYINVTYVTDQLHFSTPYSITVSNPNNIDFVLFIKNNNFFKMTNDVNISVRATLNNDLFDISLNNRSTNNHIYRIKNGNTVIFEGEMSKTKIIEAPFKRLSYNTHNTRDFNIELI